MTWRPRTCFLMTQLGGSPPPELVKMRAEVTEAAKRHDFDVIDADGLVTGRDFLLKIWGLAAGTPVGIALVHETMKPSTLANIFYEIGLMQAYGRETLVVKGPKAQVPSDFVRTEYVEYNGQAAQRLDKFFESLQERADYYVTMADQLERNPLLTIDFLRRAYLLTEDSTYRDRAREIFEDAGMEGRARNSVENLLLEF